MTDTWIVDLLESLADRGRMVTIERLSSSGEYLIDTQGVEVYGADLLDCLEQLRLRT